MLCPIKQCQEKGLFSLLSTVGIISNTIDSPLFFCLKHIHQMSELYSTYKGIESMQGFACLFSDFWWTSSLTEEKKNQFDFLIELRNAAEVSLHLREQFQDKLKDEIPKHGHLFYMQRMHQSIAELNDFLEHGGETWKRVRSSKRGRGCRSKRAFPSSCTYTHIPQEFS